MARGRRVAVSAEPVKADDTTPLRVIPKTDDERDQIRESVKNSILFSSLDDDQYKVVIDAMEKKEYKKGDWIIKQGDDGDEFYVIQQGICETFINLDGGMKMVKVYRDGESFGELALMYNCPRAASIQASSDTVTVWAMDRVTFQRVILTSQMEKRNKYERFIENMELLERLDRHERTKVRVLYNIINNKIK